MIVSLSPAQRDLLIEIVGIFADDAQKVIDRKSLPLIVRSELRKSMDGLASIVAALESAT